MSTNQDEYNGWANRETWALAVHLSNDQGLYDSATEIVGGAIDDQAEALKAWVTDELLSVEYWRDELGVEMPKELQMMKDDVGSLWRVDWKSAAESFRE